MHRHLASIDNSLPISADNEKLLYKLVIQFLLFSRGSHKLLEPHLKHIGRLLRNGTGLHELTAELQSLSKTLLHISKEEQQEESPNNPATPQNDYLLNRLDELLDEQSMPLSFLQQTTALRQRNRADPNDQSYKKIIDSVVTLLLDVRDYAKSEQQDLDTYLTDLRSELDHLAQQAEIVGQANLESIDNRANLNTAIHSEVDNFRDAARNAQELTTLKIQTSEHLDHLMRQLLEHKQEEDDRQEQAQQQIALMARKLLELETETATLRTNLKVEHDKALHDTLTGLPNRLAYNARIEIEVSRWKRYQTPLALAIWDIDHFKLINDTYGHKAGDKTLALIGQLFRNNCRETDFVARYGGEEFVILMPSTHDRQALEMAENIRKMIQNCGFNFNGEEIDLTLSCGISEFTENDRHDEVFIRADQALYRCKQQGRNRCAIFCKDLDQNSLNPE